MRRPAPLFGHLLRRDDAPRFLALIFGGFVVLAAIVAIGIRLTLEPDASDLAVKHEVRRHIIARFCRDWHPCVVPEIRDAGWRLGPSINGDRSWSVTVTAPRELASDQFPQENWELSGTTTYDLAGTWHGPTTPLHGAVRGKKLPKLYAPVDIHLSAAHASARLDWVEQHWYSEPPDHLRLALAQCLHPDDAAPPIMHRGKEILKRLNEEKK